MVDIRTPVECLGIDFGGTLAQRADAALDGQSVAAALHDAYLWCSPPGFAEAVDRAMAQTKTVDRSTGRQTPFPEILTTAARACGVELPDTAQGAEATVFEVVPDAQIDPGAADAVRLIASTGRRVILASNTRWPMSVRMRTLRAAGIDECFAAVVLSSHLGVRKPHGLFYSAVLEAAGCPAGKVLFVGDTPDKDVDAPRLFGMQALLVASVWRRDEPADTRPPLFMDVPRLIGAVS